MMQFSDENGKPLKKVPECVKQIRDDVLKIIDESKATFFVEDVGVHIPTDEALFELKAEISNNVSMYFYNLIK